MKQLYPDGGLVEIARAIAGPTGHGNYWRLFTNNYTPSLTSILADLTLAADTWAEAQLDQDAFILEQVAVHVGSIQAANIVFTNTTGGTISVYGYAILNEAKTKLLAIARFDDAPRAILNGGTCQVVPIYGDLSVATAP